MPEDSKRVVADFFTANAAALRGGLRLGTNAAGGPDVGAAAPVAPIDSLSLLYGHGGAALPVLASSGASSTLPQLRGLDWRLDIDVARRHVHDLLVPSFLLKLNAYGIGPKATLQPLAQLGSHAITFTADFATLKQAAMAIDEAVDELKTPHAKRVNRYIR